MYPDCGRCIVPFGNSAYPNVGECGDGIQFGVGYTQQPAVTKIIQLIIRREQMINLLSDSIRVIIPDELIDSRLKKF